MSFLTGNDMLTELKTSKVNLLKRVNERQIPFLVKGKRQYYLSTYDEILSIKQRLKKCNVISFSNNKGGVGKTTTVVNIGSSLAFYGFKVLLIDMDTQSNLSRHFGINDLKHTIHNAINGDINIANLEHDYYNFGKLDILTNDLSLIKDFYFFDVKKLEKLIKKLSKDYDFILLDTPPNIMDITPQALSVSDYAFMVLKPDSYSTTGAINLLELVEKSNAKLLGGVITNSHKRYNSDIASTEVIDEIFEKFNNHRCDTKISYSNIFNEIPLLREHSVLTCDPKHKCVDEYFSVTDYILNSILRD